MIKFGKKNLIKKTINSLIHHYLFKKAYFLLYNWNIMQMFSILDENVHYSTQNRQYCNSVISRGHDVRNQTSLVCWFKFNYEIIIFNAWTALDLIA